MDKFSEDFIFGAATAAYQAEGGLDKGERGENYWDSYLKEKGHYDPSKASDFYHRYAGDLQLSRQFGINGIRISIAWSRIFPDGMGKIDSKGVRFYHYLIDTCIKNGVVPFVTLHHFDTPKKLFEQGDWLSSEMSAAYVDFASFCFKEYGHKVTRWITINEPWSLAAGQYIIGHFPPNEKYQIGKAVQAMHNMMVAHARVVKNFKKSGQKGEIGIVHILETKYSSTISEEDKRAAQNEHILANQFLLDATLKGKYSNETIQIIDTILHKNDAALIMTEEELTELEEAADLLDFLGVNYYASHFLKSYHGKSTIYHNGIGKKGSSLFALAGVGERVINPDIPTTDWDWPIFPQGLEEMLLFIKRHYANYKKIYVTENGLGRKDELIDGEVNDDERIDYLKLHLSAVLRAINQGVVIKGYFVWSLMDLFSWTNGYINEFSSLPNSSSTSVFTIASYTNRDRSSSVNPASI